MSSPAAILLQRLKDAQGTLQSNRPKRPNSALDLFAGDLKLQYKLTDEQTSSPEFTRIVTEAWQNLAPADKQPYEARARAEMARYMEEERRFDDKQLEYGLLRKAAMDAGLIPGQPHQQQQLQHPQQAQHHSHHPLLGQLAQRAQQQQQQHAAMAPASTYPTHQRGGVPYPAHGMGGGMLPPPTHPHYVDPQQAYFQQQQAQQAQQRYLLAQQAQQQRLALAQQAGRWGSGAAHQVQQPQVQPAAHLGQYGGGGGGGAYAQQMGAPAAPAPSHPQHAYQQQQQQQAPGYAQHAGIKREHVQQAQDAARSPQIKAFGRQPPFSRRYERDEAAAGEEGGAGAGEGRPPKRQALPALPPQVEGRQPGGAGVSLPPSRQRYAADIPATVEVMCQGVGGTMNIREQRVSCHCSECQKKPPEKRVMSCTQFEAHAGAGSAKKWKTSLKVRPGAEPEVPASGNGMQIGKWLEIRGIEVGKPVFRAPPGHLMEVSKDSMAKPMLDRIYASERIHKLHHQRQLGSGSDAEQGDEEEEAAAAFAMLSGREAKAQAGGGGAAGVQHAQQQLPGEGAGVGGFKLKLEELKGLQGVSVEQLGKRLPGRPPKDGVYRPERLAALYGLKLDRPAEKAQSVEPWNEVLKGNYVPLRVRWAGERCSVCDADTDYDFDQLVTCDLCGITVHQSCYGVPELPDQGDMWLCRACELKDEGKPAPQCCLCPVAGGALKPTTLPGLWCHTACLQWIPEVTVEDATVMEPIDGVKSIQPERWTLNCCVCKQRMGAKIQCLNCYTAYHPLCGRIAGLHMEVRDGPGGPDGPIQLISYCPKHCTPQPQLSGVRLVKESEELGDLPDQPETPQLWNAQPFQLAPPAPLPDPPAGCARAEPLVGWARQTHGTGTGATSEEAFWIPKIPSDPPPELPGGKGAPAKTATGGGSPPPPSELTASGGAGGERTAVPAPGPGLGGRGGRWGRGGWRGGGRGGRGASLASVPAMGSELEEGSKGLLEKVDLMPLPEGVEELVPVNCNGRHAHLIIRTQRVLYEGHTLPPSKFEAMCGKADAKKWKCSIWFEDGAGEPVQAMQEWLAEHGLDRKALEALARNQQQHEAYLAAQEEQVEEVVDTMLRTLDPESRAAPAAGEGGPATEEPASEGTHSAPGEGCPSQGKGAVEAGEEGVSPQTGVKQPPAVGLPAEQAVRLELGSSNGAVVHGAEGGREARGKPFQGEGTAAPAGEVLRVDCRTPPSAPTSGTGPGEAGGEGGRERTPSPPPRTPEEEEEDTVGAALMQLGSAERLSSRPSPLPNGGTPEAAARKLQDSPAAAQRASAGDGEGSAANPRPASREGGQGGEEAAAGKPTPPPQPPKAPAATLPVALRIFRQAGTAGREGSQEVSGGDGIDPSIAAVLERSGQGAVVKTEEGEGGGGRQHAEDALDESVAEVLIQLVDSPAMRRQPQQAEQAAPAAQPAEHAEEGGSTKRSSRLAQKRQLREVYQSDGGEEGGSAGRKAPTPALGLNGGGAVPAPAGLGGGASEGAVLCGLTPEEVVGRWVRIWWPDDSEWYEGQVKEYNPATEELRVWYSMDDQEEWIDLGKEDRNGRVQLLPGGDPSTWPPPPPAAEGGAAGGAEDDSRGAAVVGKRVGVWWEGDECFYYGTVMDYNSGTGRYQLQYEDGDTDWINLAHERVDWGDGVIEGPRSGPRPDVPETVGIVCNSVRGVFHVRRSYITMQSGQEMTPTEFERHAGRAAAKKWKTSLRIDKGGGVPGMTMQDWLIKMGVDAPKVPRPSRATLDTIRRRQIPTAMRAADAAVPHHHGASAQRAAHGGAAHAVLRPGRGRGRGRPATGARRGKEGHREGCSCVICKQARRTGKAWGGMSPGSVAGGREVEAVRKPASRHLPTTQQPGPAVSRWRAGKRAYLQALPQIVAGLGPHQTHLHQVPLSRCWTSEDWVVHRWRQAMQRDQKEAAAGEVPGESGPAAAAAASAAATAAAMAAQQQLLQAIGTAFGGGGSAIVGGLAPEVSLGYGASSRRALSVKDKVDLCNATERERIAFGKSGVHGWGLFAKVPMKQDTMVIEYRGDLLRRPVADLREASYRSQGKDCYLFNLDDDLVIDATMAGNIARFTNHCCNPSLYTKIMNINGDQRLMFFARFDIQVGQELTYNYRFKAEEGEERLPCNCGAPNCSGFLN